MSRIDSHQGESETDPPLICADWMTAKVQTGRPLDSVAHARAFIEEHRINQLPVVRNGLLVGIVTDRDLRDAVNAVTTSADEAGTVESAPRSPGEIPDGTLLAHWDYETPKGTRRRSE